MVVAYTDCSRLEIRDRPSSVSRVSQSECRQVPVRREVGVGKEVSEYSQRRGVRVSGFAGKRWRRLGGDREEYEHTLSQYYTTAPTYSYYSYYSYSCCCCCCYYSFYSYYSYSCCCCCCCLLLFLLLLLLLLLLYYCYTTTTTTTTSVSVVN